MNTLRPLFLALGGMVFLACSDPIASKRQASDAGMGGGPSTGGALPAGGNQGTGGAAASGGAVPTGGVAGSTALYECTFEHDCAIRAVGCCGACEPVELSALEAVNAQFRKRTDCFDQCEQCLPISGRPQLPNFGVKCVNKQCKLYDVRETAISACSVDGDCRLRNGLGCCEGCAADGPPAWVAVSTAKGTETLICSTAGGCSNCERAIPTNLAARCISGHCQVVDVP